MTFHPVINQNNYTTFWINGKAWGTYHQKIDQEGKIKSDVNVLHGNLEGVKIN